MSRQKILQFGNPILQHLSLEVSDINSSEVKEVVDKLFTALSDSGDLAAGISAPQIGILKRIAICRRMDIEKEGEKIWEIMINPKIIKESPEKSTNWEGCLSINYGNLFGKVTRPKKVEVEYFNLDGKKKQLSAKDYFAHIVQHEIDHLNGVLFLKYVPNPEDLYTGEELDNL